MGGRSKFRLGALDCTMVSDGTFDYPHPGGLLFTNAPQDELAAALTEWDIDLATWDVFTSPYPSLLIRAEAQNVLIDVGAGNFSPSTGQLMANLEADGTTPQSIDIVILTHAHPDHIGGALDANGEPAFPNARYLISKSEWDFWMDGPDLSRLPLPEPFKRGLLDCAAANLPVLADHFEFLRPGDQILPGIEIIDAAGHTPGQIGVRVTSEDEVLLAVADAIVHPVHANHPHWYTAIDYDPERTVATRRRILAQAAAEQVLVFAYHFPSPGLGHVTQSGETWKWSPLN